MCLHCPTCRQPLHSRRDAVLSCGEHEWPVRDGIPRFVEHERDATSKSFGAKWDAVPDEAKPAVREFQVAWYDKRYGWGTEDALSAHLRSCRSILDAGCGLGYDAARYHRLAPDARTFGLDLTTGVDIARRDHGDGVTWVQGDILEPPFAPRSLDFVVSDQVIHHTPDCPRAFAVLADLVAPGGQLSVYVYRRKGLLRELADDQIRERTTRMDFDECLAFSEDLTELGRALSDLDATVTLERGVPLLGIAPGQHDVQRLIYWHFLKCFWNGELGERTSVMTNLDWYHPPYASRHTEEEVRSWCATAGLEIVHFDVIESGISVRAERPAAGP